MSHATHQLPELLEEREPRGTMMAGKDGWEKSRGRARNVLAVVAAFSFAGAASAQSSNPFAFLFGGSPNEGRSAYVPAPSYVPASPYGYGYRTLPGYSDPYGGDPDGMDQLRPSE